VTCVDHRTHVSSENLLSDCTVPANQGDNMDLRGEVFDPSSRCIESTLLEQSKTGVMHVMHARR
jgi:hypothetical protein